MRGQQSGGQTRHSDDSQRVVVHPHDMVVVNLIVLMARRRRQMAVVAHIDDPAALDTLADMQTAVGMHHALLNHDDAVMAHVAARAGTATIMRAAIALAALPITQHARSL